MRFRRNKSVVLGVGLQHSLSYDMNNIVGGIVVQVLFTCFVRLYGTLCDVCLFLVGFACTNIATGCECQDMTFRSDGKITKIRRSINEVPDNI